jgi:hypothetical protein
MLSSRLVLGGSGVAQNADLKKPSPLAAAMSFDLKLELSADEKSVRSTCAQQECEKKENCNNHNINHEEPISYGLPGPSINPTSCLQNSSLESWESVHEKIVF